METLLTKMVVFLLCFCGPYTAFGQSTTIKSTTGNGPILSGLKITNAEAVGNLREFGTMTSTPTTGSDRVDVRFSLSGKISEYRYNGKTYNTEYLDCYIMCGDCKQEKVKITATVKYGNKTITQSGVKINAVGKLHLNIELPAIVKRNTISLVSLVVEPVAYPQYEAQLAKLKKCEEEKEKETKEAEKKAVAKKQTTKTDDDFWNGGSEDKKETKTASNKKVSDKDFWDGENEKTDDDKLTQSAFRIINEYSQYNRNNDGKYSWVEDTDGNIIIPKGQYYISSFKDGLAKIEKIIRTDHYDFVRDKKVQLFETCYMDENGNKLPPKRYRLSYEHYYNPFTLYSSSMTRAEINESKRRNKAKDKNAYQQLKSIYSSQGFDID